MNKSQSKKYLPAFLILSLITTVPACGLFSNPASTVASDYVLDLGSKNGTSLFLKITPKAIEQAFGTKAGANGIRAKTAADVDHYLVYLVRDTNPSGFTPGGDPLANIVTNGGPFNVPNGGAASRTITFTNVPGDAPNYYYAVIRARDTDDNDLIKANTNFSGSPKIAVSSSGIRVDASLNVSSTTNMSITAPLDDAVGAVIESGIVNNMGNTNLSASNGAYHPYNYSITTVAGIMGTGGYNGEGVATVSHLQTPYGVAVDSSGNVYIADSANHRIRKVTPTGAISTIAGTGTGGFSSDGIATNSELNGPYGVAVDNVGNIYIADTFNHTIKKVTPAGVISTIAGINGSPGAPFDGSQLNGPSGVAVDNAGSVYIADTNNHVIRKLLTDGTILNISGTLGIPGNADGAITISKLDQPFGVAVDSAGNVYIADTNNHKIRKVTGFTIATIAGTGTAGTENTGTAITSELNFPRGVSVDDAGNVYIANQADHTIRKVTTGGNISTIAGISEIAGSLDTGSPTTSTLSSPFGVAVDSNARVYIADTNNHIVRKLF